MMTKDDLIAKTLNEMNLHQDYCETVVAEMQRRLPEGLLKICSDFGYSASECCESCHNHYPHYDMYVVGLRDGLSAWVCCPVRQAIDPKGLPEIDPELWSLWRDDD